MLQLICLLCLYSRDAVVKEVAVTGVSVIQASATTLRDLDVLRLPMPRARPIAQSAHPQQQHLMNHRRTTRAICKVTAATEDTVDRALPPKDSMERV